MNGMYEYPSLSDLSLEELKALKKRWIEGAKSDGSLRAIDRVVRELGTPKPKKHGAIWTWEAEGVSIWLDDWTGAYGASYGKAEVCHVSHFDGCRLFVPGPWVDVVRRADIEAQTKVALREGRRAAAERSALVRQLGGGCQHCGEPHGSSVPCGFRRSAP